MTDEAAAPRRTWVITGASRGLGRAIAEHALLAGDAVAAIARDVRPMGDLVASFPGRAVAVAADIGSREAVAAALDAAHRRLGRIDVLVNSAGDAVAGAIEEVTEAEARSQLEVNFFGALWCSQLVLPYLRAGGGGHIVQMSSTAALRSRAGIGLYSASKFALEGFSEALAAEVAAFDVRVIIVELGPFRTGFASRAASAAPMAAYNGLLGIPRSPAVTATGEEPGDPRAAARVLARVLDTPDPPLRLPLGVLAVDLAQEVWLRRAAEAGCWATLGRSADAPETDDATSGKSG